MRQFTLLMVGLLTVLFLGCAGVPKPETVYIPEDKALVAAFDSATAEEAKQTEILQTIADTQARLLDRLEQQSIGKPETKVDPGEAITASIKGEESEVVEAEKPKASGLIDMPEGIRLQVWEDLTPECQAWIKDELPKLDVKPEMFTVGSETARKYGVNQFSIWLVDKYGNAAEKYTAPFSAEQIAGFASGIGKVSSSGTGQCQCPNCNCLFDCDCSQSSVSTNYVSSVSTPVKASTITYYQRPAAVQMKPTRVKSRGTVCIGGTCFQY